MIQVYIKYQHGQEVATATHTVSLTETEHLLREYRLKRLAKCFVEAVPRYHFNELAEVRFYDKQGNQVACERVE